MAMATNEMIIGESRSLHQGIAHGCAHEAELMGFEVARHLCGEWRYRRYIAHALVLWLQGGAIHIAPKEGIDATVAPLELEERRCIVNHGGDFGAIADNPAVAHQPCHIGLGIARHNRWVKLVTHDAVVGALAEHGNPTQPGLHGLEDNSLIPAVLAMERYAPLGIVVGAIERVMATPWAAFAFHLGFFVVGWGTGNHIIAGMPIDGKRCVVERNHPAGRVFVPGNMP